MTDKKRAGSNISEDALPLPVPVNWYMASTEPVRTGNDMDRTSKAGQSRENSKADPANADPGQNRQITWQERTGSSGQVNTRTMLRTGRCRVTGALGAGWPRQH